MPKDKKPHIGEEEPVGNDSGKKDIPVFDPDGDTPVTDDYTTTVSNEDTAVSAAADASNEAVSRLLRQYQKTYLGHNETAPVLAKINVEHHFNVIFHPVVRNTPATKKLFEILADYPSVKSFMQDRQYYADFKKQTAALGLADNFDYYPEPLTFEVPVEKADTADFEMVRTLIEKETDKLKIRSGVKMDSALFQKALLMDFQKTRSRLISLDPLEDEYFTQVLKYFDLLMLQAKNSYAVLITSIVTDLENDDLLAALGKLNEFYRDKIGNELIALETDNRIRSALEVVLDHKLEIINRQFARFDLSSLSKNTETEMAGFTLSADPRDADSLLRGTISCDCTDILADFAFHETIPQHLLDPGLPNFRMFQGNIWVGNVYCLVASNNQNEPVLIIDAIQTSEKHTFPARTTVISQAVIAQMKKFAAQTGFKRVYLSNFISNRGLLHYYLDTQYPSNPVEIQKTGGFQHLKELGLWDENTFRNEYLETFMAGNPNLEKQTIPLREV